MASHSTFFEHKMASVIEDQLRMREIALVGLSSESAEEQRAGLCSLNHSCHLG